MKRVFNIIIVLAILLGLIITEGMYIDLFELCFILLSCLILTVILGRRIAKNKNRISWSLLTVVSFVFYIMLTSFDIVGDYVISELMTTTGSYIGESPTLGYVLRETYSDFMPINLLAPILIGLVAACLSEIKSTK